MSVRQATNGFYQNGTRLRAHRTRACSFRPDLIVSGINNGANMRRHLYSRSRRYLFGIPSIAF